jgi:7-carboxy-7-deazaguanine synthase
VKKINNILVSEIFLSIQGEGVHVGRPATFLRLSKCTRKCSWCDSSYHKEGREASLNSLATIIKHIDCNTVVVTGGEPLLQFDAIELLKRSVSLKSGNKHYFWHVETNGDLLYSNKVNINRLFSIFDYVAISPKSVKVAKFLYHQQKVISEISKGNCSIKVVTDLSKVGVGMLKYASMLMPLTTYSPDLDLPIKRAVWDYCKINNIRYSPRLHIDLYNGQRGK